MTFYNRDNKNIVIGMPLVAFGPNGVRIGGPDQVIGIAADNATPNQPVKVAANGTIERDDWRIICGEKSLVPGRVYYIGSNGKLASSGSVEAGRAETPNRLAVSIRASQAIG